MAIIYLDGVADATCNIYGPYAITGSNDQFSITIDGGSPQVFTLTHGAARTAAQIVADLSGLTSAVASVATVGPTTYVRIRTTSANNASSTILFNTPSNNSNAILGFVATTYTGGTTVNALMTASTKAILASNIEDQLNNAGWVTISGHHSAPTVMQSSMTPANQNLRMQVTITTTNTNTVGFNVRNVPGSKSGSSLCLLPAAERGVRIIANKYQCFLFVPYYVLGRDFVGFGVPFIPPFMEQVMWEVVWGQANANSDTDASQRSSIRTQLQTTNIQQNSGYGTITNIINGIMSDGTTGGTQGCAMPPVGATMAVGQVTLWWDNSYIMADAIWLMSFFGNDVNARAAGLLWEACVTNDYYYEDTVVVVDSNNFYSLTLQGGGGTANSTNSWNRGAILVRVP